MKDRSQFFHHYFYKKIFHNFDVISDYLFSMIWYNSELWANGAKRLFSNGIHSDDGKAIIISGRISIDD